MSDQAREVTNTLLRLGVLDPEDPEQRRLREQLLMDQALYEEVRRRLADVGWDLVQFLAHLGVRLSRDMDAAPITGLRGTLGLDARHVRVLVFLWVQLLYREIKLISRDEPSEPVGRRQTLFGFEAEPADDRPSLPLSELEAEFAEVYARTVLKGILTTLERLRFVARAPDRATLRAGPALYVLIDHERMEEHVVRLARRGALELPGSEGGAA